MKMTALLLALALLVSLAINLFLDSRVAELAGQLRELEHKLALKGPRSGFAPPGRRLDPPPGADAPSPKEPGQDDEVEDGERENGTLAADASPAHEGNAD